MSLTTTQHWGTAITWSAVMLCAGASAAFAAVDTVETRAAPLAPDSVEWIPYVAPNSEDETYLRYLQIAGGVRRYPWTLRGFSPAEARRLTARVGAHPWSGVGRFTTADRTARLLPFEFAIRANSAFPYGSNDGPVWAGRGLTASVRMAGSARWGPISLLLAPAGFITQNAAFDLLDNGKTGDRRFADGLFPNDVDRPQRFGDGAYGRVDPGNSTARIDLAGITVGASTANLAFGPFEEYPFVLGTNAPGFAHAFAGTSEPANVGIGSLHARMIWARLSQTRYSPVEGEPTYVSRTEPGTRRFATGLLAQLRPRGIDELELGVARFFHAPWPRSGIPPAYFWKSLENVLKHRLKVSPGFSDPASDAENQLISGFARWTFPAAGLEIYAEYGREDHSWDKRDFVQEPDHTRSYGLGFRKTLRLRAGRIDGVMFEMINFQLPHLDRSGRGEGAIYIHSVMRQGHTHRGQLLGADVGVNAAAGSTVRWDAYGPSGRTSFALRRIVRQERNFFHITQMPDDRSVDVQYALQIVRGRRHKGVYLTTEVALIHQLNRNFDRDVTGVSATVGITVP